MPRWRTDRHTNDRITKRVYTLSRSQDRKNHTIKEKRIYDGKTEKAASYCGKLYSTPTKDPQGKTTK